MRGGEVVKGDRLNRSRNKLANFAHFAARAHPKSADPRVCARAALGSSESIELGVDSRILERVSDYVMFELLGLILAVGGGGALASPNPPAAAIPPCSKLELSCSRSKALQ